MRPRACRTGHPSMAWREPRSERRARPFAVPVPFPPPAHVHRRKDAGPQRCRRPGPGRAHRAHRGAVRGDGQAWREHLQRYAHRPPHPPAAAGVEDVRRQGARDRLPARQRGPAGGAPCLRPPLPAAGRHRHRGLALLRAPRHRLQGPRPGSRRQPGVRRVHAGRVDPDTAIRQERPAGIGEHSRGAASGYRTLGVAQAA